MERVYPEGDVKWYTSGSLETSILTLSCATFGVGFLALHTIGRHNGFVPMVGFIVLATVTSTLANWMLGRAFLLKKAKNLTELVENAVGKAAGLTASICHLVYVLVSVGAHFIFGNLQLTQPRSCPPASVTKLRTALLGLKMTPPLKTWLLE